MKRKYGNLTYADRPSEKTLEELKKEHGFSFIEVLTKDGHTIWIPQGVNPDLILRGRDQETREFSYALAEVICEKIAHGAQLNEIYQTTGLVTRHTLSRWRRENSEFEADLQSAMRDRAELHAEKALEIAKNSQENTVQSDKLKVETLKHAAACDYADRFGKKTKVKIETGPMNFILETGIKREDS